MEGVHRNQPSHRGVFRGRRVHLIGIGGCGMQGAATVLLEQGAIVSGSDAHAFPELGELTTAGAVVSIGHHARNVGDHLDVVVTSAAVPETNPELARARALVIRTLTFAELLGELMRPHTGVAIAGTHGKSTTTGLTTFMFREAGLDPSFLVGATSAQLGGRAHTGRGEHFIAEACEYNRSFLRLRPVSAAVLNVEAEHLDYYRDLDDLVDAFGSFCGNVAEGGLIVANQEDEAALRAAAKSKARTETFGFAPGATWRAVRLAPIRGCFAFDVLRDEQPVLHARLQIPGRHNVANALAATALATHAGVDIDSIVRALSAFGGVDRRMSIRGQSGGVTIVDDYAHHPTEIRMTLEAARARFSPKRLWVVFQPHQYSRTRQFIDRFAESFGDADEVLVPDIYGVRDSEADRRSVRAVDLVDRIHSRGGQARHIPGLDEVTTHLEQHVSPGDLVLTMGAGDVWKVADGLVERFRGTG